MKPKIKSKPNVFSLKILLTFLVLIIGVIVGVAYINSNTMLLSFAQNNSYPAYASRLSSSSLTPNSCKTLFSILEKSYLSTCSATNGSNYDPRVDFNKDKNVNSADFSQLAANYAKEEWCIARLNETTNPCLSGSCEKFFSVLQNSFLTSCGQDKFDPRADINLDKRVGIEDLSILATNYKNEEFCNVSLNRVINSCTLPNELTADCRQLLMILSGGFGKMCSQYGYDSRADFNKDGLLSFDDFSLYSSNINTPGWCASNLKFSSTQWCNKAPSPTLFPRTTPIRTVSPTLYPKTSPTRYIAPTRSNSDRVSQPYQPMKLE